MRGVADTSWLEALPTIGVALLVIFVPGVVAALLLRCRPATALASGPVLTVTAISLGGIAAALADVRWGAGPLALSVLALWVVCAALGLLPFVRARAHRAEGADEGADEGPLWPLLAGAAVGLAGVAATLVSVSRSADAFPQHPDTVFHLSTVRWMLQTGDVSTLDAGGYANGTGTGFYPAGFHAVATTVGQLSGATVVTSVSATVLVTAGLVWPLGLMLLARRVLGPTVAVTLSAAVASIAFTAFPYWFLGYGVLWPNLFGQALLPAVLAAVVALANGPDRWNGLALLALAVPGLAIAHPNALIALVVLGVVIAVFALFRAGWVLRGRPGRAVGAVVGAVLLLAVVAGGWIAATTQAASMRASNPPGPEMPWSEALVDIVLFSPRNLDHLWAPAVGVAVGLVVVAVRHTRQLWVVAGFLAVATLYVLSTAVDDSATRTLTWPWYNNPPRLAALLVVPAALLLAAALDAAVQGVIALSRRWRPLGARPIGATTVTAAVCAAYLVVSLGADTRAHRDLLHGFFDEHADSAWVTRSELGDLTRLGRQIPRDAVVAANPYNGGSYLYLVSGRHLLYPSEKAMTDGDLRLLGRKLDDIGRDPEVCAAARRHHVDFVITGGHSSTFGPSRDKAYNGLSAVSLSPAFQYVTGAGPYRLYKVVGCAGS